MGQHFPHQELTELVSNRKQFSFKANAHTDLACGVGV